jgi:serine/threonine-protein kinase
MPKALDILSYLVTHSGTVVEKDELMSAIWPDTNVEENNLTQNISALRRALGERHKENRFIATVPGRGYKFVAEVVRRDAAQNLDRIDTTPIESTSIVPRAFLGLHRPWLFGLAVVVVVGLATVGFFWSRENQSTTERPVIHSLAVLPFKPLVSDHRDEAMEFGMADTLILKLSGGDKITVRPLGTVRRFASLEQDPIDAGKILGVDAVLDGAIQIANDRVRISAKLLRVTDGKQLWAGQYDERSSDIFSLQDSISERVASALQATLGNRRNKNYTDNLEAYQLFSKGKFHTARLILPEVQKGIAYYEQAIVVDPTYALAYVELATAYRAMVLTNDARPSDVLPKAKAYAMKAIELDSSLAEAHTALAIISFWYDFDPESAERFHLRALELDPNSSQSLFAYAHFLSNTGRFEEALTEIKRARELDPVSLVTNALEGQILFFAGRDDEALKVLTETAEMDKNFWLAPLFLTRVYLKKGMWDEAVAAATKASELSGGNSEAVATIGYAHAKAGRIDAARSVINELESRRATRYVPSYGLAAIYDAIGERQIALDLLERSFAEHDALMVFLKVDTKWDVIRSEPRFIELMRKMKFN